MKTGRVGELKNTIKKGIIGASILFATMLPLTGRAQEKEVAKPKLSGAATFFIRQDFKSRVSGFGAALNGVADFDAFKVAGGVGIVTDENATQFDLTSLALIKPILLGEKTSLILAGYVFRDLQTGVTRCEGIELSVSHGALSAGTYLEHLDVEAYPLSAWAAYKAGAFKGKLQFTTVIAPGSRQPNIGGRVFLDYALSDRLSLNGNVFLMSKYQEEVRRLAAVTAQLGFTVNF